MDELIIGLIISLMIIPGIHGSCFDENSTVEDLEIGPQLIDVFLCKLIEIKEDILFLLPMVYFVLFFISMFLVFLIALYLYSHLRS